MRWVQGDCWQQLALAASKLLLNYYSLLLKEIFSLWCLRHPPIAFLTLLSLPTFSFTHIPRGLWHLDPRLGFYFKPYPPPYELIHYPSITLLQSPPSQPHSTLCHHWLFEEFLKFKLHHQPPLCSAAPSLQLFPSSNPYGHSSSLYLPFPHAHQFLCLFTFTPMLQSIAYQTPLTLSSNPVSLYLWCKRLATLKITPTICLPNWHITRETLHQFVASCHYTLSHVLHPHLDPQTHPTVLGICSQLCTTAIPHSPGSQPPIWTTTQHHHQREVLLCIETREGSRTLSLLYSNICQQIY